MAGIRISENNFLLGFSKLVFFRVDSKQKYQIKLSIVFKERCAGVIDFLYRKKRLNG